MRSAIALAFLLAATNAFAQAAEDDPAAPGRRNQKIERLVHEDSGSRIEEVRVGGQVQSITVQPKADLPEYSVEPANLSRTLPRQDRSGSSEAGGTRSWTVLKF
jgi:starvation-inducible outer membrane lipoprotein